MIEDRVLHNRSPRTGREERSFTYARKEAIFAHFRASAMELCGRPGPCAGGWADRRPGMHAAPDEKGNPTLKTTLAVMKALGVQLTTRTDAAA